MQTSLNIPIEFREMMQEILDEEYADFLACFEQEKTNGLRINTLKVSVEEFLSISPFQLKQIPWSPTGFYYEQLAKPGKHPYHAAGLYYIQEPSAMAVVEVLAPEKGDFILDISAAPGGKSTHIAQYLNGTGLLIANEINSLRAKILAENIERMGIINAIVTNEEPAKIAELFPNFFDKILVDAPCSGEGMFRKDHEAINEWSKENVEMCAIRQEKILNTIKKALKPTGILVYSTCTFNRIENEGTISKFLAENKEFELVEINEFQKIVNNQNNSYFLRLWPHKVAGEGHFVVKLRKKESDNKFKIKEEYRTKEKNQNLSQAKKLFQEFINENLEVNQLNKRIDFAQGAFHLFGNHLSWLATNKVDLPIQKLKINRLGLSLGEIRKNLFVPNHALAIALPSQFFKRAHDLTLREREEWEKYLKGETLPTTVPNGWAVVTIDGYPLGWGKGVDRTLKNHYPKGLRWKN